MNYKIFSLQELLDNSTKTNVKKLLKSFKCSKNVDLEKFLHNSAILFEEKGRSRTYLYVDTLSKIVVAYFTISISSLYVGNYSEKTVEYLQGHRIDLNCLPCYLIGQLGKSDYCDKKIGKILLKKSISIIIKSYELLNGRFILIDAVNNKNIIDFYQENGFILIENLTFDKKSVKMIYWLI